MGVPRRSTLTPGKGTGALNAALPHSRVPGTWAVWPKVLLSLKPSRMGLEDPLLGVWRSLAESRPLFKPLPSVSSGPFKSWRLQ